MLFVQTTFPAPYRVEVLERLSLRFSVFVAYENAVDSAHARSKDWYANSIGPHSVVVGSRGGRRRYRAAMRNLEAYDAVLIYEYSTPMAMRLMLACIWKGVPYAINADGGFIGGNLLKAWIKRFFVRRAHACLAGSASAERYFLAYDARPSRVFRHRFSNLQSGDIRKSVPDASEKAAKRRILGLPAKAPIVLGVGQFIPRKGFDVLLDAWRSFDAHATLVIMGGGPEVHRYQALVAKNNLKNVVIRGYGDKAAVFDYYLASDCFVLPTREDVWGLVVNEAMACALPVVTTNTCVAGVELIERGINGFTVDPDDPIMLGQAIGEILRNPELRNEMAHANIEKISSHTIEALVKSHESTLASIVHPRW